MHPTYTSLKGDIPLMWKLSSFVFATSQSLRTTSINIIPSGFGESTNWGRLANIKGLMFAMLCGQRNRIWHTTTNQKCDWFIFGWRWGYGHSNLFAALHDISSKSNHIWIDLAFTPEVCPHLRQRIWTSLTSQKLPKKTYTYIYI